MVPYYYKSDDEASSRSLGYGDQDKYWSSDGGRDAHMESNGPVVRGHGGWVDRRVPGSVNRTLCIYSVTQNPAYYGQDC